MTLYLLEHFAKSVNCSVKYHNYEIVDIEDVYKNYFEVETGLKYGVDLHIFGSDFVAEEAYHSKIDFSVSFDNYAVCIATPRCGFMSQGLVIFKSFTPVVWVLTLLTIFCFGLVQYGIQYLQGEIFIHLYSETQREYFKISSSLLTVYAYFVCGRPPFLYLGRLITGKILFIIFSFSAIIISTAFLSSLTTLLSNRVSYPEIDSLQALEESDLLIQTTNAEKIAHEQIFDRQKLREKLVSNLASYSTDIFIEAFNGRGAQDILDGGIFNRSSIQAQSNTVISILKSDAHLVTVLYTSAQRENILLQDFVFVREALELHLVKECLLTYPVSFLLPKGSFFYDRFNQVVAQFFETGHSTLKSLCMTLSLFSMSSGIIHRW